MRQYGPSAALMLAGAITSWSALAGHDDIGFEADQPGTAPDGWQILSAADALEVAGAEGPADFPVYDEFATTVEPRYGERMLRLATPRSGNEAQTRGQTAVGHPFTSDSGRLSFSLRLFSFEHRGDDILTVDVWNAPEARIAEAGKTELLINVAEGRDPRCSSLPCTLAIDVGKSTDRLDTGWIDVEITDLPVGVPLTLVYSLTNGQNESTPTWVYFDADHNREPVARISYAPGSQPGTVALEGDFVVFDCLSSTDDNGDPLTCTWEASGPGVPQPNTTEGNYALFSFPQDGNVQMSLTVSDGRLTHTTTEVITITNGVPKANALDVEVPAGGVGTVLCRWLDPGVLDQPVVTLTVDGQQIDIIESGVENEPSLSSGYAKGHFDASLLSGSAATGSCTVDDGDGGVVVEPFSIAVLTPADLQQRESEDRNSTVGAPLVSASRTVLGNLDLLGGDVVDVMELRLPNGATFPPGAEVLVNIDVPADFDAALLSASDDVDATPFVSAPFVSLPFVSAPFVSVPFVSVPFVSLPFVSVPFVSAPFVSLPFVSAPFVSVPLQTSPFVSAELSFSQFPLTQVGLAAPDGGSISAADVDLSEILPLQQTPLIDEPVRLKAISAELGNGPEQLLVRIGPNESRLYLALFAQLGSESTAPYAVSVEASTPPPQSQILGAAVCEKSEPLVPTPAPKTVLRDGGGAPKTLVVTQRERMITTWNMPSFDGEFLTAMDGYFNHPRVAARVISLPSAIFDQADLNPCSVQAQNGAAAEVKAAIQAELAAHPSIEYVQIMGGFDIVTPFYTPDGTSVGYEGLYTQDLFVQPGTPLSVAIAEGNNITDAYYVDADPQPFQGRELYVEDLPIARLLEKPEEMLRAARTFVDNNGEIFFGGSVTTGYDFFIDGADANAEVLAGLPGALENSVLNDNGWTVDDLRCRYLGNSESCNTPGPQGITALGAHMTYNAALSAAGFTAKQFTQALGVEESKNLLDGTLTVSLGCHSGLSVPDAWALPLEAGLPFSAGEDWAQQDGSWIGSYTYAYGDDLVADRGTEGIVTLVLRNLAAGQSLGQALVRAKWEYGAGLFEFGVYDEKSMIALTLFGMPQATLAGTGMAPTLATLASTAATSMSLDSLTLKLTEKGTTTTTTHDIARASDDKGVWYTFDGQAQAVLGRPLLPVVKPVEFRETPIGETTIHGIALRGGSYNLVLDEDPAFPVQQHDWVQSIDEPQPCVQTMAPTQLAGATRFETGDSTLQTVIVQGGQFRCTSGAGSNPVTGDFRIWNALDLEALHPASNALDGDFQPPTVTRLDLIADRNNGVVTATVDAVDNFGLVEIIGLVFADDDGIAGGPGTATAFSTGDISNATGPYELALQNGAGNFVGFQFIDNAGNIAWRTLKGALFQAVGVEIRTSIINGVGTTELVIAIADFDTLQDPVLTIDYGDGTAPASFALTDAAGNPAPGVVLDPLSGEAVFTVDHTFDVTTATVTVVAEVKAQSAFGSDTRVISRCGDPAGDALNPDADIVGCGFTANGTDISIDFYVLGAIASSVQYRIELPQSGKQLKYNAGQVTGPGGSQLVVTELSNSDGVVNGLRFTFRASRFGWDGESPFQFLLRTQEGAAGAPGVGFDDESQVFSFVP